MKQDEGDRLRLPVLARDHTRGVGPVAMVVIGVVVVVAVTACRRHPDPKASVARSREQPEEPMGSSSGHSVQKHMEGPQVLSQNNQPWLVSQTGHTNDITAVAISSDGRFAVSADAGGMIFLWEVSTGREIRSFKKHRDGVTALAISPDSQWLISGGTGGDSALRIWELASGKQLRTLRGHYGAITSIAVSHRCSQLVSGSDDGHAIVWDIASGALLHRLTAREGSEMSMITAVAISQDTKWVAAADWGSSVRLFDTQAAREIRRLVGHTDHVIALAISPNNRWVLTSSRDGTARLWDLSTGRECQRYNYDGAGHSPLVFFIGNSPIVATGGKAPCLWDVNAGRQLERLPSGDPRAVSADVRIAINQQGHQSLSAWDIKTKRQLGIFQGTRSRVNGVAISRDSHWIAAACDDHTAYLWDLVGGKLKRRCVGHRSVVNDVDIANNQDSLLTSSLDRSARLWNLDSGKEGRHFGGHTSAVKSARFVDRDRQIVTVEDYVEGKSWGGTIRFWDATTAKELHQFKIPNLGRAVVTSDGQRMITHELSRNNILRLWDTTAGKEISHFDNSQYSGWVEAIAPDCSWVATRRTSGHVLLFWDPLTHRRLREISDVPEYSQPMVSHDGKWMLMTGYNFLNPDADDHTSLWELPTGRVMWRCPTNDLLAYVRSASFSADEKLMVTSHEGPSIALWDLHTGRLLCRLVAWKDFWAVVASDGRFDVSNVDNIEGLHWIVPDDPFTPLPIEVFMRDYYEPRLLARILKGEKLKPIRDLQSLNCVQPSVTIAKVEPQPGQPNEVTVTVEVADESREFDRNGSKETLHSGVFDVRLFRDGQLVRCCPRENGAVALDANTRRATLSFDHITLPRKTGVKEVEFSGYAFNCDRVKSETARRRHPIPDGLTPRKGNAYLVCIGVSAFDNGNWDLGCAASDARAITTSLKETLKQSGQFDQVISVPLISDAKTDGERRIITENTATKANLRAVLAALAGEASGAELLKQVPEAAELRKALPEDLVLLAFSTHGCNGDDGQYYLFPSDIGTGYGRHVDEALKKRLISTDELSRWLRDVDVGEMVMIVDACYSAASVEQEGFKPGPMGSRGLGQLAYDKRMRILAASRASECALEDKGIGHGLLTYALLRDGLERSQADFDPADGRITLGEWLRYGVQRVPVLADDVVAGRVRAINLSERSPLILKPRSSQPRQIVQQPSLFDFTKGHDEVLLHK